MPNAAARKRATMASSDTDDNVLISATLLVGTIANVHKRKRKELIKEVSGHVSGSNSVRDEMLAYHSLLRELKEVSGHVSGSNSVRDEMLAYHSLLRELVHF